MSVGYAEVLPIRGQASAYRTTLLGEWGFPLLVRVSWSAFPCPEHGAGLVQIGALDKRLTAARGLTASLGETLRVELRK